MIIPALDPYLNDPTVTDLCLNGHSRLFIDRGEGMQWVRPWEGFRDEGEFRRFVLDQLSKTGKGWDAKLPFVDCVLFGTHRAHVAFPPLAPGEIHLSLRRLPVPIAREVLLDSVQTRWGRDFIALEVLRHAVLAGETVIIAGGTGSGKTTLLSDLLAFLPEQERLIALEDTAEIRPGHPHFISLLARSPNSDGCGGVTIRELLRQSLRMRPDRILLGECRGEEVLDLLQALNSGHRGTLATLHANSARDALRRIELLTLLAARGTLPSPVIRELIFCGVQWVVHLVREKNAHRRIASLLKIEGMERETIVCRPVYSAAP
jgi:pilus assembly protein CpaF